MNRTEGLPAAQGLYRPENEHESCGIGFVAHIKGAKSHDIVRRGLEVLVNMTHRGAESADNRSGDGAGITVQLPHELLLAQGFALPEPGEYGAGLVFLPRDEPSQRQCREVLGVLAQNEGLRVIGYRQVPVNSEVLGQIARAAEPRIEQVAIAGGWEPDELERKLYLLRKQAESQIRGSNIPGRGAFYISSLSSKTMVYKGMLTPAQLGEYYLDLTDSRLQSAIALIHSRFSTNTFPTWALAQPFRLLAHNGEINTIQGNRLWMRTRESLLRSEVFGRDLHKLFPVIEPGKSDSASLDNVLEFLVMTGRTLPHALSMLVPESWNDRNPIPESLKAFYEYHSTIMEPWDGPASLVFTDGRVIGGTLDRNGLRPSRYVVTTDDLIVMGSEVGVQVFAPHQIREKGRLRPGKILLVDTQLGVIVPDQEIKAQLTRRNPYGNWLKENRQELGEIQVRERRPSGLNGLYHHYLKVFGYTKEDVHTIIAPMATEGKEPTGSMGNDAPLAVLSDQPQRLFSYFKQLFAQVTNPPIDPIREGLVMSLTNYIGSVNRNLLEESPSHCKLIKLRSPIITNTDLGKIKDLKHEEFSNVTLPMLFPTDGPPEDSLDTALRRLCQQAEEAVDSRINYIILSDKGIMEHLAPIPSLLAVAAVHHHLINAKKRMQVGLIVESAEPREVMHFALLLGYGASVINPYGVFAVINNLCKQGQIGLDYHRARENYIKAVDSGLLKVLSKMGISTLRSYHGAQIFEAVGLHPGLVDRYFCGTASQVGGIGLREIAQEVLIAHREAHREPGSRGFMLHTNGQYAYRKQGEHHAWNPETIGLLQWATRTNSYAKYKEFSALVNEQTERPTFLRGLLDIKRNPIGIDQVEPAERILTRFVTGAMSYGSISQEAHEALAIAMNSIGGRSNTGEGGEAPERFAPLPDGTSKRSAIKQIASGRFGVTASYLRNADEIQIKMAQGAKPGEGGQLPGFKVNGVIAKLRHSTPGITLISPPPHHDIYSIEDLAQLIFDLKCVNPDARVSVKLVSEGGVGTVAAGVTKAFADLITISGNEGGTGASPLSSIKHAGLPIELGIAEAHQTLVMNNLRGRVRLQTDGQLKTGLDVVKMGLLGAEEFGFSTSALIVLGCVMMRKCHMNTCPVGVATQHEALRQRFVGRSEYVVNYFRFLAQEVREILAQMGFSSFDEIVGRADRLEPRSVAHWKAKHLDLSKLLHMPGQASANALRFAQPHRDITHDALDRLILPKAKKALRAQEKVWLSMPIANTNRSVGTMLSGEVARLYGEEGLPHNTIRCKFYGSAGQSFGAFLAKGITLLLEGDANDYLGKGLSGGTIVVTPPAESTYAPERNIIVGNTVLYGATSGEVYVRGVAGERFCVRNSGASAVVEGVGDHCCEYMTGGRTVVLGETGRNFAAGMSGGIAYVLDLRGNFGYYCNQGLVELLPLTNKEDVDELQAMINRHWTYTGSRLAEQVLVHWDEYLPKFVKVIPFEYKKVMQEAKVEQLRLKIAQTEDDPQHHY